MEKLYIFLGNVVQLLINPLIGLLFALALAYFVWGGALFVLNADNPDKQKEGKQALIWGIVGLFIMTSVIGLLRILTNTFGVDLPQ